MVQIMVKMVGEGIEWGMIELQGVLETKDDFGFNGMYIGDLHFDDKGTPNLIVGHHLLVGKIIDLEKPFAVLSKKINGARNVNDVAMDTDDKEEKDHSYDIVGTIRRKIIFKNRPRPIITNPNAKG